jgi:hypothetical protein
MPVPIILTMLAGACVGVLLWRLAPRPEDRLEYTVAGIVFGPLALLMPLGDCLAARERSRHQASPTSAAVERNQ